jgi:hypothetical protein
MSKIRELETRRAQIAEHRENSEHDRAAELARTLPQLEREAEAERLRVRAAEGGQLAALADQVVAQQGQPQTPAWQENEMTAERRARRAALSPMLGMADELAEKQRRERGGR